MQPIAPEGWLTPFDQARLTALIKQVEVLWTTGIDPQSYTPHDPSHFRRVEHNIQGLIPKFAWQRLNDEERFLLSCAAWTHDIAMNPKTHFAHTEMSPSAIRGVHVSESADWVMRERKSFALSFSEATVLSEINLHHSRQYRLEFCSDQRVCNGVIVRPRLLAAYLRLADALEVGHERVDDWELQRFLFLQDAIAKKAEETLFHWIKSFVVSGITPCAANQHILVEFQIPETEARKISKQVSLLDRPTKLTFEQAEQDAGFALLARFILDEVNEELETVEEVLAMGGVSTYHFVKASDAVVVLPERNAPKWSSGLTRVVNDLRVAHSPNSSGTAKAALNAIGDTLSVISLRATSGEPSQDLSYESIEACPIRIPVDAVSDVMAQLRKNLQARLESRLCHVELRRISDFVVDLATDIMHRGSINDCREWLVALEAFRRKMVEVVDRPNLADSRVARDFWARCSEISNSKQLTVLLFGNSGTVANVIAQYRQYGFEKLYCYVAEGRPKTMHGARNLPTYLDGEAYAETLRDAESRHGAGLASGNPIVIRVIPDIAVGTVLDPSHAAGRETDKYPRVDAVVFGTNGIFINGEQVTIAHTCGHLSIAATAKQLGIPVFVIASAAKIQSAPMGNWQSATREDKGRWIGSAGSGVLDGLKKLNASVDWNPREDHVPITLLDEILTDLGGCKCATKGVADSLRKWERMIDAEIQQHQYKNGGGPHVLIMTKSGKQPATEVVSKKTPRSRKAHKSRANGDRS